MGIHLVAVVMGEVLVGNMPQKGTRAVARDDSLNWNASQETWEGHRDRTMEAQKHASPPLRDGSGLDYWAHTYKKVASRGSKH